MIELFIYNKTLREVSHHQVRSKIKSLYQNIYTECVSKKRLFTVHLGLRIYVTQFLCLC